MRKTEKYQLPQWEREDRILMEDFNQAMSNIEEGIEGAKTEAKAKTDALEKAVGMECQGKVARIAWGTAEAADNSVVIEVGFRPLVAFLFGESNTGDTYLALKGAAGLTQLNYSGQYRVGGAAMTDNSVTFTNRSMSGPYNYVIIGEPL